MVNANELATEAMPAYGFDGHLLCIRFVGRRRYLPVAVQGNQSKLTKAIELTCNGDCCLSLAPSGLVTRALDGAIECERSRGDQLQNQKGTTECYSLIVFNIP